MSETDKEYKYRCLCSEIIEYFENRTDYFDDLCDCKGNENLSDHSINCRTMLFRRDVKYFEDRLKKIQMENKDE